MLTTVFLKAILLPLIVLESLVSACPDGFKEIHGSFCGGIAALQCKGEGQVCQLDDIPGGADMGGVCCEPVKDRCPRDTKEVAGSFCGGIAGLQCPKKDQFCQSQNVLGGADMSGVCCERRNKDTNDICRLSSDAGPCFAAFKKWYFDHRNGQCKTFTYGGCGGNDNKFDSKDDCEKRCGAAIVTTTNVCGLPAETGPCRAAKRRWYFNDQKGSCQTFVYGGCRGNANRFQSKEACEKRCGTNHGSTNVCQHPPVTGPCKAAFRKWYYDHKEGQCKGFTYGGCGGNNNRFDSKESCNKQCGTDPGNQDICSLKADSGPCEAATESWFYDKTRGTCRMFIYGGCDGNENNFVSKQACMRRCDTKSTDSTNVCQLPPVTGPCRAAFRKWYYDHKNGRCKTFIYGGCSGNNNRFDSKKLCNKRCSTGPDNQDICSLKADPGPCEAAMESWFYDKGQGACRKFIYGGCDGNENNFSSKQACQRRCAAKTGGRGICRLNKQTGPCRARIPSWYFDHRAGNCRRFTYGGCRGNANRFKTKRACRRKCKR